MSSKQHFQDDAVISTTTILTALLRSINFSSTTVITAGIILVLSTLFAYFLVFRRTTKQQPRWPPGPSRLRCYWQYACDWRTMNPTKVFDTWPVRYGDIMSIWRGSSRVVVMSSAKIINDSINKHPTHYNGREKNIRMGWHSGILLKTSDDDWQHNRKQTVRMIRTATFEPQALEQIVDAEMTRLFTAMDTLHDRAFDPRVVLKKLAFNVNLLATCSMSMPYDLDTDFRATPAIEGGTKNMKISTANSCPKQKDDMFNYLSTLTTDVIWILQEGIRADWYPYFRLTKEWKFCQKRGNEIRQDLLDFVQGLVQQRVKRIKNHDDNNSAVVEKEENHQHGRDLIEEYCYNLIESDGSLIESDPQAWQKKELNMISSITDSIIAFVEAPTTAFHWFIYFVIYYQDVQQKMYEEMKNVLVQEDGSLKPMAAAYRDLHYSRAAMSEALRCANMVRTVMPHVTNCDTEINGYDIPAGTTCIINNHYISHCKGEWGDDALDYKPERHLNSDNEWKRPKQIFIFGAGGRVCPGEDLSLREMLMWTSRLLLRYELRRVPGVTMPDYRVPLHLGNESCDDFVMFVKKRSDPY